MLEEFLIKAHVLLLNIVPEPDDFDAITAGGFVSLHILYLYSIVSQSTIHSRKCTYLHTAYEAFPQV